MKLFVVFAFLMILPVAGVYIYRKLMHFGGEGPNGLSSRFVLWRFGMNYFRSSGTTHQLFGNGVVSGTYLIRDMLGMGESYFHNVFLNTLVDEGIVGLTAYVLLLVHVFFNGARRSDFWLRIFLFVVPVLVCINSQYLGFDNDLVVYFAMMQLLVLVPAGIEDSILVNPASGTQPAGI